VIFLLNFPQNSPGGYLCCWIERSAARDILNRVNQPGAIKMSTDTTLFEIYSELNILDLMQTEEGLEFITEECEIAWNSPVVVAA
jgi:hypothetical protein